MRSGPLTLHQWAGKIGARWGRQPFPTPHWPLHSAFPQCLKCFHFYTLFPVGLEVVFASLAHQKSFILPLLRHVLCSQLDFPKIVNPQGCNLSKGTVADSTLYPPQDPLIEHSKYSTSIHSLNEKVGLEHEPFDNTLGMVLHLERGGSY